MLVTSFFPGRIRLRAPIFKDAELYQKARRILEKLDENGAIKRLDHNPTTGSVLIEYETKKLPMEKLTGMQEFFTKLGNEAERYSSENRTKICSMLEDFENGL